MRRGLLLFVNLGLLGALAGCQHHTHGVCDCQVQPIDHVTPSPIVKPAVPLGEPIHPMPATSPVGAPLGN